MATLPQLIEEDIRQIDEVLLDFVRQADLIGTLVVDKGGFLITNKGDTGDLDLTTIGALASGAFMATQTIAGLVNEKNFNSTFQQGEKFSLYILEIDDECLLVIIFSTETGLGVVKYYSGNVATAIARQLNVARERNPGGGFDLSVLNLANPQELFRKKS
ncbi:MAG TPA: roadblock/LC7 domain-containing protein [Candidatus Acidoferrum sp.]|jgi:predicted regulator of Ras-like GTPase activity (Roadblock/LC7/MglB family)|nr:roadblock/LC7 domain-containing protein [Candidatus Acidoferrum sp.]